MTTEKYRYNFARIFFFKSDFNLGFITKIRRRRRSDSSKKNIKSNTNSKKKCFTFILCLLNQKILSNKHQIQMSMGTQWLCQFHPTFSIHSKKKYKIILTNSKLRKFFFYFLTIIRNIVYKYTSATHTKTEDFIRRMIILRISIFFHFH